MSLQGRVSSSVHVARKRVDDIDETVFSSWSIEQQTGRKWNIQPFAVRIIYTDLFSWYTLKVSSPLDKQELTARSFLVHRASTLTKIFVWFQRQKPFKSITIPYTIIQDTSNQVPTPNKSRAAARKDGVDPATPGQAGDRPTN
ncbi:hypothetical protein QC761_0089500 [Podospora bellae-mahoneyi]|uniref:Uncharacterized protein n=1 Tax=Podospora bellae-mahoneyi TaxID=2093777 RepID=A0ABR0FAW4_9PEZI|nr:hypothetical protein QC761_0089500 [Podospora bellae-mahoneyi]